ncbi:Formylglycine-generating enzyme, required for sulfatase activity, contains SUMF1/FGE domain [Singulisphaera sp. GP187]|nr:Formylglycine-generating enzyme, required for sulfatase activity, contains SUMF1/FGE domain [Singulisphaera sp. GP187]
MRVTLRRGFWMGKFEVTQDQWQRVMGMSLAEQQAKEPRLPRRLNDDGSVRFGAGEGPDYPIYFTSHDDAEAFCRKLTEAERDAGRLEAGAEYCLPTEAQWEFACRAGTTTATAFGDRLGSAQANFDGTAPFQGAPVGPYPGLTTPVGRYPANAWGLHDMHGNLWEWCRDGYVEIPGGGTDPFETTSLSLPSWPIRGGCWHNEGRSCLSSSRSKGKVAQRGYGLGFRVALLATAP